MITALQAAQLCEGIYSPVDPLFDTILTHGGIVAGLKHQGGDTILAFRGSANIPDWLRDFECMPEYERGLGWIDSGFYLDVQGFCKAVEPMIKGNLILTGHSLGAIHSVYTAANIRAAQLTVFGCPRASLGDELSKIIAENGTQVTSFRNWADIVPTVPFGYLPIIEPTTVYSKPQPANDFEAHKIGRYVEAVTDPDA